MELIYGKLKQKQMKRTTYTQFPTGVNCYERKTHKGKKNNTMGKPYRDGKTCLAGKTTSIKSLLKKASAEHSSSIPGMGKVVKTTKETVVRSLN